MLDDGSNLETLVGVAGFMRGHPVAAGLMSLSSASSAGVHNGCLVEQKQRLGANHAGVSLGEIINQFINYLECCHGEILRIFIGFCC